MTKHTPGPWTWGRTEDGHEIRMGNAINAVGIYDSHCVIEYNHSVWPYDGDEPNKQYEEAEANARLIAAAPDLLAACKEALIGAKHEACKYTDDDPDWTWHCCDWSEVVEKLEKAIAKAEGREME